MTFKSLFLFVSNAFQWALIAGISRPKVPQQVPQGLQTCGTFIKVLIFLFFF